MDINFRSLLTGVESLGLDAQSLRDFQTAAQSGRIEDKNYTHLLSTLGLQLGRVSSGSSEVMAVQLLISRLDKKLKLDLAGAAIGGGQVVIDSGDLQEILKSASTDSGNSDSDQTEVNQEILHQLRLVTEEVRDLRKKEFHTILPNEDNRLPGLDPVFVNPIDESKVEELETNITIKSKTSPRNLKEKIKRLKELKSEKEKKD